MKRYFLYNILLNIGLILIVFAATAAYNSTNYPILAIVVAVTVLLAYLKYRVLKHVRQLTRNK